MGETFEAGAWNVEMEVNLFHAMRGHKPVGVNRHFHMIVIHEKLSTPATKKLTATDVWNHLSTMYDLQALNESEIIPFPNKPIDFMLPAADYKLSGDSEFPRMQNVGMGSSSTEEIKAKPEGQAKGGKASRSDSKATSLAKVDSKGNLADPKGISSKGDSKSSTPESKSSHISKDSKSGGSSSSGRGEGKGSGKGGHSSGVQVASSTPSPSSKRTKRTRHNQSANNSPASDAPPAKRRR